MKLILASTSPRRIQLMRQAGLRCRVTAPEADETPLAGERPRALVLRLCRAKARSVGTRTRSPGLVIAADTIVVAPGGKKILGKPGNPAEARKMLALLSGRTHTVLTGYCVLPVGRDGRPVCRVVESRVRMRSLAAAEIASYVRTGEPMDKAGAYAAQGIGMALIESIRGSYANVVGLPICQLAMDLENHFGVRLFR